MLLLYSIQNTYMFYNRDKKNRRLINMLIFKCVSVQFVIYYQIAPCTMRIIIIIYYIITFWSRCKYFVEQMQGQLRFYNDILDAFDDQF